MYILGLTTLGDAAATLIYDGEVVAAVEEERFSRQKHHIGFPYQAIEYCLSEAEISLAQVDHVGLYWKPWLLGRKALHTLRTGLTSPAMFRARVDRGVQHVGGSYLGMFRYPKLLRQRFGPSDFSFHYLDHHLCHAASAFFVSPFDEAAILTLDGTGEATTTLTASGKDRTITPLSQIRIPHSLGQFFSAVTNFLGFDMVAGDEWKVMGLAAYGTPRYASFFSDRVLQAHNEGFRVNIGVLDHHLAKHYQFREEVTRVLGPPRRADEVLEQRHKDIAASAQLVLEEIALHLARGAHRRTGSDNLCLAGGVAFNSVMNGRLVAESPFKKVFIQPVAGDAGCSLGAAYLVYHQLLHKPRCRPMLHTYFGPSFTSSECAVALRDAGLDFETLPDTEMLPLVAQFIADGSIVGWFQGRAEFGPRALGNRSFLADPRRADMRDILNKKVKLREWFRPLAPSLIEESATTLFGTDYFDPYMATVVTVLDEARDAIPAVVHVDGTARPQTVSETTNPRYWGLIRSFESITGVPVLLNTSFNVQEPIVCTPGDAIRTFLGADFDVLVIENHLVRRHRDFDQNDKLGSAVE